MLYTQRLECFFEFSSGAVVEFRVKGCFLFFIVSCRGSKIFPKFVGFLKSKDPNDGTEQALLYELTVFNDYLKENVSNSFNFLYGYGIFLFYLLKER